MPKLNKKSIVKTLRWSESLFKTDMVYLAKGGSWLTLNRVISTLASFLLSVAFANLLPKETYGSYKYILSVVALLASPSLSGMGEAVVLAVSTGKPQAVVSGLKIKIRWGLWGSILSLAVSGYYYFFAQDFTLTIAFLIATVLLPWMEAFNIYGAYLQGKKEFNTLAKYSITSKVIASIIMAVTIFLTSNLVLIVLAYFIPWTILRYFFLNLVLKRIERKKEKEDINMGNYGKHLSVMNFVNTLASQLDRILAFNMLGAVELAVYSFAIAVPEQIKGILTPLDRMAMPQFVNRSLAEIKHGLSNKFIRLFALAIVIIGGYYFIAPYIYTLFFPEYTEAIPLSQLFALSMINLTFFPAGTALRAHKKIKSLYISNFISSITQIILVVVFILWLGLLGMVIARIISRILGSLINVFLFYRAAHKESIAG